MAAEPRVGSGRKNRRTDRIEIPGTGDGRIGLTAPREHRAVEIHLEHRDLAVSDPLPAAGDVAGAGGARDRKRHRREDEKCSDRHDRSPQAAHGQPAVETPPVVDWFGCEQLRDPRSCTSVGKLQISLPVITLSSEPAAIRMPNEPPGFAPTRLREIRTPSEFSTSMPTEVTPPTWLFLMVMLPLEFSIRMPRASPPVKKLFFTRMSAPAAIPLRWSPTG